MPKTYRAAVIGRTGKGDYGHGVDTVWKELPNVELLAVADDNKEGLAKAAQRLSLTKAYADYRQMLDEIKPDIVGIGPRWIDQHRDMVLAAAERGIHIYMEKPFCRSLEEADEIVAACERTHVKLAIAHQTHYSPKTAVVKQLLAEGKLGRVLEYRGRGKEDASRGGGEDLWVLGSHVMDLIRHLGGEPTWCQSIVLQKGQPIQKSDVKDGNEGIGPLAGDEVHATYGLASGAIARFDSVRGAGAKLSRFGLQIYGSNGVLEIVTGSLPSVKFLDDGSWSPGRSGAQWQNVSSAGIGQPEPLADGGLGGGNVMAVQDLIAAIEEDRQPLCGIYEGRGSVEMIAAIFES
ncbi:MAG: Gfo/Idh/MocA family protein, partial [Pirellulales bacterium]